MSVHCRDAVQKRVVCHEVPKSRFVRSLLQDVKHGLSSIPRGLPPKYFYDETGSMLFDQICNTEEYYPTRTESDLLRQNVAEVITAVKPDNIIEFGSGTSRKSRILLDAVEEVGRTCVYWPFDVCREMLIEVAEQLEDEYSWLSVQPLLGDYTAGLAKMAEPEGRNLYVFLGSSIGNFTHNEAVEFLSEINALMKEGDALLVGFDRHKDQDVLESAYNDAGGVTALFNMNVLEVLNKELKADFHLQRFNHVALYNKSESQIEMYLEVNETHNVDIHGAELSLTLEQGERILTEISRKFTPQYIEELLSDTGMSMTKHFSPEDQYFSLVLAEQV